MTLLQRRRRTYVRLSRGQLEAQVAYLEKQRDKAIGKSRALRDAITVWLEQRADAYQHDADHLDRLKATGAPLTAQQRRVIADELRQCAIDFEESR